MALPQAFRNGCQLLDKRTAYDVSEPGHQGVILGLSLSHALLD